MQVTLAAGGSLPREGSISDSTSKVPRSALKIRAHAMKITLEQETVDDGVTKRLGVREEALHMAARIGSEGIME